MKKQIGAMLLCIAVLFAAPGCSSILNGSVHYITPHENPTASPTDSMNEASTYDELKAQVLKLIRQHEDTGIIRVNSYDGDLTKDVGRVCQEVANDDPLGAFAVSGITGKPTLIVSYYQVQFHIDYKVTKDQINNIMTVSTLRYLKSDLQSKIVNYASSLTVQTVGFTLSEDQALEIVKQIYYENPLDIVILPVTQVDIYPDHGPDRILVFTFGYRYEASTRAYGETLKDTVQKIAGSVTGSSDGAILLSLCKNLMDRVKYDTALAQSGDYSNQNKAATAYGALIEGSAVGEGYAMAYKALCDELGIECYVVLGQHEGKPHAWNIVYLDGHYYHIDVSMCDVNGIETAFLKNDAEMKKTYQWDTSKYKVCDGPLTYSSLVSSLSNTPTPSPSPSPTHAT